MKFQNPIIRGMYPDPSVCRYGNKYYMVCSTFQYFPGVPLFESEDMVNWKKIGHCLTRPSQVDLEGVRSSGGIFAPTIRCHNGRFYMVTTNDSISQNFYVYTDDIYGEWSEPVLVDQDGIDPSLYFEGEHAYFISNGSDEHGVGSIQMCEIDIETGKKLSSSRILWQGTGGRYLESPHLYRFGEYYYLVEAEGGTEYGHMVNYARSKSIWGPYESYPGNPVLTNRNLGGYQLQAAGHGDIVEDCHGNWWFVHLAFRQIDQWLPYHHLGRETCLEPLQWQKDGWFTIGAEGTARLEVEVPDSISFTKQTFSYDRNFGNLSQKKDWLYLRIPTFENYRFEHNCISLAGSDVTLNDTASPTFTCIPQTEFDIDVTCDIIPGKQESGISFYMDEMHHYEIVVVRDQEENLVKGAEGYAQNDTSSNMSWQKESKTVAFVRQTIGCISQESNQISCNSTKVSLHIVADALQYHFYLMTDTSQIHLADAYTRYLSSEVASGFTGVMIGLYAVNQVGVNSAHKVIINGRAAGQEDGVKIWTRFENLHIKHKEV